MTGIPNTVKEKFENLSGLSFDDVRVYYNSNKPAQLQALAYTYGNHVYIAPGQEMHLEHELVHVVQQKQGRVKPTRTINGFPLNDDPVMEQEASLGVFQINMKGKLFPVIQMCRQVHHIFPKELFSDHDVCWIKSMMDMESEENKVSLSTHRGSHNRYTSLIKECILKYIARSSDISGDLISAANNLKCLLQKTQADLDTLACMYPDSIYKCFGGKAPKQSSQSQTRNVARPLRYR
ncbi:MAG: DUF4157 domain-containing protein [Fibromonadales bacterium]|nr:DUF4157 domain-containing protein [Fibromonadales bacterium]